MAKFHIKEDGSPGACSATVKACPRGGEHEHYDTAEDARRAYEKVNEGTAWGSMKKPAGAKPPAPARADEVEPDGEALLRAQARAQAQREFAAADVAWRNAVALWESPDLIHSLTEDRLAELAAVRNKVAARIGAPDSATARQAMYVEEGRAIQAQVKQAIGETETNSLGRAGADFDEDRARQLAYGAQRGYERTLKQAEHGRRVLERGNAPARDLAESDFLQADLRARIAKAKLAQLPTGGLFGRKERAARRTEAQAAWVEADDVRGEAWRRLRSVDATLADKPWPQGY